MLTKHLKIGELANRVYYFASDKYQNRNVSSKVVH